GSGAGRHLACHCERNDRQDARRPHRLEACATLRIPSKRTSRRDKHVGSTTRLRTVPLYLIQAILYILSHFIWNSEALTTSRWVCATSSDRRTGTSKFSGSTDFMKRRGVACPLLLEK